MARNSRIADFNASDAPVVIVGAGIAGVKVAETLRAEGFKGGIVLLSEEPMVPYDRPPLSKQVLLSPGYEQTTDILLLSNYAQLGIEMHLGCKVTAIERDAKTLTLSNGKSMHYSRLVLATGSRARTLPLFPADAPGIHYLRTMNDALKLRDAMKDAARIAIIGAGVIGLELAAAAIAMGCSTTVIEAGERVMARATSPLLSGFVAQYHIERGVDLRLCRSVVRAEGNGPMRLFLSDGRCVEADIVAVGVGVVPNMELGQAANLDTTPEGIVVDGFGMTSDPNIYAAGEVAVHFNAFRKRTEKQETWMQAATHGEHVGRALKARREAYAEPGYYWSDQYDLNLQVVGEPMGDVDVLRGDPRSGQFSVFHLRDGVVVGASICNSPHDLRTAKALIRARAHLSPSELSDCLFDLRGATVIETAGT
jgi:3-phenylpropionate/trans-cinnamate dioxygenase ferredoxin reductase subunit